MESHLTHLLRSQNADGGWGYFPGKESWLEPTVYAIRALAGQAEGHEPAARAFRLLQGWQRPSGAFSTNGKVAEDHWSTALIVNLAPDFQLPSEQSQRALRWILATAGVEGGWIFQLISTFRAKLVEQDDTLHGWPWRSGNSSWVEPTSHTLLAIKLLASKSKVDSELLRRAEAAESFLWDRRCPDGGWNYGNRRVYRTDMPSFPETTGLALLALQKADSRRLAPSLAAARKHAEHSTGRLGRAWLAIARACHQQPDAVFAPPPALPAGGDILVTALESIALQPAAIRKYQL